MSVLSVQGEQSSSTEIDALNSLAALATGTATQVIRKSGPTTFENINIDVAVCLKLDQSTPQSVISGTPSFYDIKIPRAVLGTPTYSTLNDFNNSFGSCGRKTGGICADAGSSKVSVTAGTGFIKATDDDNAQLMFFDWAAPSDITIPANSSRYIGVEYNAGSPQVVVKTTPTWNYDTEFPLARAVNETINGAESLYVVNTPWWVTDGITNVIQSIRSFGLVRRDEYVGGLIVSNTGTRNIAVTAGTVWAALNDSAFAGIDTSSSGTVEGYWYKAGSGWQSSDITQWSKTQWNDVTQTTLQTIDNNKFCNVWIYGEMTDSAISIALLYPQAQYNTAAEAEAVGSPTNVPTHISALGMLLGRFIIKQNVDTPVAVESVFGTTFSTSVVTDHGNLAGLSDDDHTQYLLKSTYDANSILYATTDNTPVALVVAANNLIGRVNSEIVNIPIDSDLSSVSAGDDTVPSAKATKTALDLKAATGQTFYIGTTQVAINRASAALTLAGLTLTTPDIGTPAAGVLTNCSGYPINIVDDTTPELGGEMDAGAHSIGFTQQPFTGDGTTTIDWKLGNKAYFTFGNANETFTFTAPSNPCNLVLVLKQYSTGGKAATWPATVMWPGGNAPTLSTGNNAIDIISFYYDGTNYYGVSSLNFSVPA